MKIPATLLLAGSLTLASALAYAAPVTPPLNQTLVKHDNVQIEVNAQGKGPVIVMLPSLGRSGRDYDQVAAYLVEQGFRVVRPEPRGIGRSQGPMDKLSVHDFARDVAAVVEHEHQGPVVVVGHAWGNFPARQLAVDRPDLVRGVVLAAASAGKVPPGSTEKPINAEMRQAIDGAGNPSLSEEQRLVYLRKAFFAPGNDPRVWLNGWHEATHEAESHARNTTPVDDYFAAGKAPILDLQGEADAVAPRRFSGVLKSMLGDRVQVVVLKNAGHAMAPEQPKAMADAIGAFARDCYKQPSRT
ncbi:alpha/beta hydrolase [uncultured Pseudomonas sp.]|uniref:alpha/beta fold hydrolase n=1 Tax=uncultured Pseudomonas sp. TaxID=114707 RepID=UPI0025858F6F|nr:alpha/beta hydrolase [uncultured Pseudomonas sp.]